MTSDNWKNKDVFRQQLERNVQELNGPYPEHWTFLLNHLNQEFAVRSDVISVLDAGCGVGAVGQLLTTQIHHPLTYRGVDYSLEAVEIAQNTWGRERKSFIVKDFQELTPDYCKNINVLHATGLVDIMEDGTRCMRHLLSLGVENVLLTRINTTDKPSYAEKYEAYGIETFSYKMNYLEMADIVLNSGYRIKALESMTYDHNIKNLFLYKE